MRKLLNSSLVILTILALTNGAFASETKSKSASETVTEGTTVPDIVAAPPFNDEGPGGGKK